MSESKTKTTTLYTGGWLSEPGNDPQKAKEKNNEDYANFISEFKTVGGLSLTVALVCDGVGGKSKGEVAAMTAGTNFITYLQKSVHTTVPQAVQDAATKANQDVREKSEQIIREENEQMSCTFSAAILHQDGSDWGRLYVANMGDSRVGLIRDGLLLWLTREHNVRTDSLFNGISYDPKRAHRITRAMGARPDADVDFGLYHTVSHSNPRPNDVQYAISLGMKGEALREGDTIICCTDGITEENPYDDNQPYLHHSELEHYALDSNVQNAVRSLKGRADGRQPRDDYSLVMVFVAPNSKLRHPVTHTINRKPLFIGGGILVMIAVFLSVALIISNDTLRVTTQTLNQVALESTQQRQSEEAITLTVAAYTPTPSPTATMSPTPIPPLLIGQWGSRYANRVGAPETQLMEGSSNILPIEDEKIEVRHINSITNPASFYLLRGSNVRFVTVGNIIRLEFLQGDLFIHTGQYSSVVTELEFTAGFEFSVSGSCMAVMRDMMTNQIRLWCFEGTCGYRSSFGQSTVTSLPQNSYTTWEFDVNTKQLSAPTSQTIHLSDVTRYRDILGQTDDGVADATDCLAGYIPTPTPTATTPPIRIITNTPTRINPIIVLPSNTSPPVQQNNPPVVSTSIPTNTPKPTSVATGTPEPTSVPTNTPEPTSVPTNTPEPTSVPTNTPEPTSVPTNTPEPTSVPTNTPEPTSVPTNTPEPTSVPTNTPE
mgnify:CR=1 FL=1